MNILSSLRDVKGLAAPLDPTQADQLAAFLSQQLSLQVYSSSLTPKDGQLWFLANKEGQKVLGCTCPSSQLTGQTVNIKVDDADLSVAISPTSAANAVVLRENLPFTAPSLIGLDKSFGGGDRLGLASPAHIRAVRGKPIRVFLAQQSIREMARTDRSPRQVMDDATFAVLQEGFRDGFGSDADHLKNAEDIDRCLAAGFTLFTIDPGQYVNDRADDLTGTELQQSFEKVNWANLQTSATDCLAAYARKTISLPDGVSLTISAEQLCRAAVKYGAAVAHTARMHRHLLGKTSADKFELEMSVDETDSPTSLAEHYYVAAELRRLGVRPVSLAPRFVGKFEKGVDYQGDLQEFQTHLLGHVAIARELGPYKISFHSGSDKFTIYPIAARIAGELVHLKTAGTSYLEALRCIGKVQPDLFRNILAFAFERYDEDKATYHVSAVPAKIPQPKDLKDAELTGVLDLFDGRQLLHVTYGSVLQAANADGSLRFKSALLKALQDHEEEHYAILTEHINKHVGPFC